MIFKNILRALFFIFIGLLISCNRSPKVIEANESNTNGTFQSGIFKKASMKNKVELQSNTNLPNLEFHKVLVVESLPGEKYLYLKVKENSKAYWIATRKLPVVKNTTYYYKGGLLKTNFESKEFNKVFDSIYLVSNLVSANHSQHINNSGNKNLPIEPTTKNVQGNNDVISIATLISKAKTLDGKMVTLEGKCVKINPGIMNRNWIHIKDGSLESYDLVITSNSYVEEGKKFRVQGKVTLNKDFGAGYRYDIIIEEGKISNIR